jgi:chromosome segregation ATPase
MRQFTCLLLCLALSAPLLAQAQPKDPAEQQIVQTAQVRAGAEIAVRQARVAADDNENGWRDTWNALEREHAQGMRQLENAIRNERAKSEEMRDEALIQRLETAGGNLEGRWQDCEAKRQALNGRYERVREMSNVMRELLNQLQQVEQLMKETGVDLIPLKAEYEAVQRRAAELKTSADKLVADLKAELPKLRQSTATPTAAPAPTPAVTNP